MELERGLSSRPITREHVNAWAGLIESIRVADGHDEVLGADDLLEDFDGPAYDFERGSVGVYDGEAMVGHATLMLRAQADPVDQIFMWGGVHPGHRARGIGGWLVSWAEQAAAALHRERFAGTPLTMRANCPAHVHGAVALFEAHGYQQTRWFRTMVRDLAEPLPASQVSAEIEVLPLTPERSADAHLIRNESFRDHWGSIPLSDDEWKHFIGYSAFRPAFSFVAYAAGQPAGVVISHEYDAFTKAKGKRDAYIVTVGTLASARKQGIATALLARAMAAARDDGCESASLEVDADSPTGALGLYQRLGFTVTDTWVTLTKDLPSA